MPHPRAALYHNHISPRRKPTLVKFIRPPSSMYVLPFDSYTTAEPLERIASQPYLDSLGSRPHRGDLGAKQLIKFVVVGCNKIAACPSRHIRLAGWYQDCGLTGPEMDAWGNLTKPLHNKFLLLPVPLPVQFQQPKSAPNAFMNHTAHAKLPTQNCPRKTAHAHVNCIKCITWPQD